MALNLKSVTGAITGTVLIFWITLYASEERWELSLEKEKTLESPRVQRSVVPLPINGGKHELSESDVAFLRQFGVPKLQRAFKPIFTGEQKAQVMEAMRLLTDALDAANIDYFLYGGSLIGSWRHHDIVPWDDDIDIIVNISNWQALELLTIPGHTINIRVLNRYKVYNNNASNVPLHFWKWPFIDICFFGDNGTHLYDMDPAFSKTFVYDKRDVFPLARRPFGKLNLKAPKNVESILQKNYNVSICKTGLYDHRKEKGIDTKDAMSVDCRLLHRIYPFVIRNSQIEDNIENVYLDKKLLTSVDLHSINL